MPSVDVDFVYDRGCPNVKAARANLMRAFSRTGISARWREHQIGSPEAPAHVRGFGSPTILVDGADVAGHAPTAEACCRIYLDGVVPDVGMIVAALERATPREVTVAEPGVPRSRWKSSAAVLPAIGVAFLPKVVCPLCWPAYGAILSSAGLAFLMEDRWLLPISAVFLLAALAALAWRARTRRGYGPFALGAGSAGAIMSGKFLLDSTSIVYLGIAALVIACVWNAWPRRASQPGCAACPVPE